jgi:hypothetical protein
MDAKPSAEAIAEAEAECGPEGLDTRACSMYSSLMNKPQKVDNAKSNAGLLHKTL